MCTMYIFLVWSSWTKIRRILFKQCDVIKTHGVLFQILGKIFKTDCCCIFNVTHGNELKQCEFTFCCVLYHSRYVGSLCQCYYCYNSWCVFQKSTPGNWWDIMMFCASSLGRKIWRFRLRTLIGIYVTFYLLQKKKLSSHWIL